MNQVWIPKGYAPLLDAYNTQKAIAYPVQAHLGRDGCWWKQARLLRELCGKPAIPVIPTRRAVRL